MSTETLGGSLSKEDMQILELGSTAVQLCTMCTNRD